MCDSGPGTHRVLDFDVVVLLLALGSCANTAVRDRESKQSRVFAVPRYYLKQNGNSVLAIGDDHTVCLICI